MVMENLSFGRKVTRQYDLKGALHARFTATSANGAEDVLLDQNFVNDMNKSPLYVSKTSKQNLQRAVYNDTSFLTVSFYHLSLSLSISYICSLSSVSIVLHNPLIINGKQITEHKRDGLLAAGWS